METQSCEYINMKESMNEFMNDGTRSERAEDYNRSEEHYSFPVISIHAEDFERPCPFSQWTFLG